LAVVSSLSGGITDSPDGALLNFTLTDIAPSAGVRSGRTFGRAVAWGDYDQDGWLDLVVCNSMGRTLLYRNNGDVTFTDVSGDVGIPPLAEPIFGAVWIDYDNDGDQDICFAIGAEIQDEDNLAAENRLLRNDVNTTGRFTDVTAVANASGGRRRSWGSAWADYDNDSFLDVYISNMNEPNVLLRNRGDGTFEDMSVAAGVADEGNGRFPLWLDYNLDGWMDIFVVNAKGPDRLYRNNADGTFTMWPLRRAWLKARGSRGWPAARISITMAGPICSSRAGTMRRVQGRRPYTSTKAMGRSLNRQPTQASGSWPAA
jgi:hypothetical protein